jgi:hypothetical protein
MHQHVCRPSSQALLLAIVVSACGGRRSGDVAYRTPTPTPSPSVCGPAW